MASTEIQTATNNWRRRINQFRNNSVPDSAWMGLYQQDMANVDRGGQAISDAEIYAGVSSALHGPQIADPQPMHGGHGWFSGIGDTLGNIGHDISGIVTGWPAGLVHVVRNIVPETENTGKLLAHLATGDNNWLIKNGYLTNGDRLHESWGDFATILRAMNTNGNKQLLGYMPFISVAAELTNHQGRVAMMQHPVGSFLDVLPGIAKAGELSMAGRSFGYIDELNGKFKVVPADRAEALLAAKNAGKLTDRGYRDALKLAAKEVPYGSKEPRFWAAGRALQAGNPVKALVSAAGDILPGGSSDLMGKLTLREKANLTAASMGMARWQREGMIRNFHVANNEFSARIRDYQKRVFGDTIFNGMDDNRAMFLWLTNEALVNPRTGEVFRSKQDYDTFVNNDANMSADERGAVAYARDVAEGQRRQAVKDHVLVNAPYGEIIRRRTGTRPTANILMSVPVNGPVHRAFMKWEQESALASEALRNYTLHAGTEQSWKDLDALQKHRQAAGEAQNALARAQVDYLPNEWQAAMAAYIRSNGKLALKDTMAAQQLAAVSKELDNSVAEADIARLLGPDKYEELKNDAINWWLSMAKEGMNPLWLHTTDVESYDHVFAPRIHSLTEGGVPKPFRPKDAGIYFGNSVMDIMAAVTSTQVEMMRHKFVGEYLQNYILPRSYSRKAKLAELQSAVDQARSKGVKGIPDAETLLGEHFVDFRPSDYYIRNEAVHDFTDIVIDKDTKKLLTDMVRPNQFIQAGGKLVVKGTSLYKFAVLTGVRHMAHVVFGGMAFMMLGEPLAPLQVYNAWRVYRAAVGKGNLTMDEVVKRYGLAGQMLSGLKQDYYEIGKVGYDAARIPATYGHLMQVGSKIAQDGAIELIHQARKQGAEIAKYIPNKLAQFEEFTTTMYKIMTTLSAEKRGLEVSGALEQANKLFVDVNGLSVMERTWIKQIFPFYAFTRHLFRYLFNYPVDHPYRASILTNFAEGEQADWQNGLPRMYMNLYWLGTPNSKGDILTFDLKNTNPFRSFANDWSWAGFTSSLSPFMQMTLNAIGVDSLSGTTELYPSATYDPFTGSLQSTPRPGWEFGVPEAFVPQLGLLDHFFQLTKGTQVLAQYNRDAYNKQLYDMLNIPFVPETINVPYEKEVTEMRRFRAAQAAATAVERFPSAQNVAKLMQWNAVPFDNTLVAPGPLAAYYKRVQAIFAIQGEGGISPKAGTRKPPTRKATFSTYDTGQTAPGVAAFLGGNVNVPPIPAQPVTGG